MKVKKDMKPKSKVKKPRREYRKTFEGSMKKKEEAGKKMMVEMRLFICSKMFFFFLGRNKAFIDVKMGTNKKPMEEYKR